MFGTNEIVGQKFFKDAQPETLLVTSRFYTLQGEGPYRGLPAYFIRLTKCNLACSFCDTYFDSGEVQTFGQIFRDSDAVIRDFYTKRNMEIPQWARSEYQSMNGSILPQKRNMVLVMTGGEPTLQKNLAPFLDQAQHYFQYTQIESNGTVDSTLTSLPTSTTVVVSPKCSEKRIDGIDVARRYLEPKKAMLERANCLKFVMCAPEQEQFTPYSEIPAWAHEWAQQTGKPIFVSPMNIYNREPQKAKMLRAEKQNGEITIVDRSLVDETISFWEPGLLHMEKNQRNHEYTAEYCMKYGFTLNLQLHLYASLP